jgi:hypothetical protein
MSGSRILALDYGTKRIGVALSDELGWTAQPLETFERRTLDRDVAHVASLVQTHEVRTPCWDSRRSWTGGKVRRSRPCGLPGT